METENTIGGRTMTDTALPLVVDAATWQRELDALRVREKAATRELDAIAAQRRRMPAVLMPDYTLEGEEGKVRLADVFDGKSQLIVYNHMWFDGEEWQCPGCTGFTSQFTRLEFLDNYDARFVIVTQGPIDEALAYKERVGNKMTWYSTANSPFGADVGAPPGGGFGVNVFLRDGDTVYRTWHTNGRGCEQPSHIGLIDLLPYGRQEEWQDSPDGWPKSPTYSRSQDIAAAYGPKSG
jgi:predicted dithiol-disulfide oxidoreductase (DUF899 family)